MTDSFYFVHQPLARNGTITVRVASLTGLVPAANLNTPSITLRPGTQEWAKAGIIIKQSLKPGSEYAAMMVAAGHGVRMQWNYTADRPGLPGTVGPANPRWLRLTRAGDVITGYDSADGTHWVKAGAVTLPGLPSTVQAGLFAASPDDNPEVQHFGGGIQGGGGPTQATAVIDHVSGFRGPWAGTYIGAASQSGIGAANGSGTGRYHQAGGRFTVTGSGDIAPVPAGNGGPAATAATVGGYLLGTFAGLIALAVVATMFMTAEYRRNLIRVTLAASPRRGRALAAKAVVIGAVAFVTGLAGAGIAVLAGTAVTHARGTYQFPVTGLDRGPLDHRHRGAGGGERRVRPRRRLDGAPQRGGGHDRHRHGRAAVLPVRRRGGAVRRGGLAAADHPRGGLRRPGAVPTVSAGQRSLLGRVRVLPARPVDRACGAVRLDGGGAGRRGCAAAPPGRLMQAVAGAGAGAPAGLARPGRGARTALPDAVHAEWTKLRTLAGTWWLLAAAVAVTIAAGVAVAGTAALPSGAGPAGAAADPARLSLAGVTLGQAIVALLAVLAVGGEYGTGMIRVTLAATPRRMAMLTAKAVVVTGGAAAAGAVAVLGSVLAGRLILPGRGLSAANGYAVMSLGNGPDLRAAAGSVLYLALIALLALGVTTAVRDSAVGTGLVLGLLYLFPIASAVVPDQTLARHLEQAAPMTAGLWIQATAGLRSLPLTPWQGLGVLALWALGALILGAAVLRLRDA